MFTFTEEYWERLGQVVEQAVMRALAAQQADPWMSAKEAADYIGCPSLDAFYQLRRRHPQIDEISVGSDRLRRWRRSDLDQLLRMDFMARRSPRR